MLQQLLQLDYWNKHATTSNKLNDKQAASLSSFEPSIDTASSTTVGTTTATR